MGVGRHTNSGPFMGLFTFVYICVLYMCAPCEVADCEPCKDCTSCCGASTNGKAAACPRRSDQPQRVAEQCGSYVRNQKLGKSMKVKPRPHQDLVTTYIYQCIGFSLVVPLILSLGTLYVLKSHATRKSKGSSQEENLSLVQTKKPTCTSEDQADANDFLREVASLYQEAVREVDFATVGRRVGLKDYQIEEIINNQAEELRGEAMLKYRDWYSTKSPQGIDDLRDDIVAERIKLLPDILVQYKRPQRCVAYAG